MGYVWGMKALPETIKIHVSAEDKAAFEEAARTRGLSLSAWARTNLMLVARSSSAPALNFKAVSDCYLAPFYGTDGLKDYGAISEPKDETE